MPDLPDDLAALLRARAGDAPEPPAPSTAMVRSVRRRQAVRAGAATLAGVAGVVAVVAVAATAAAGHPAAVTPAKPGPVSPSPSVQVSTPDDKYGSCTGEAAGHLVVAVHPTELKFQRGCYLVRAGVTSVVFSNPQTVGHNLVVAPEGGEPFWKTDVITARPGETATVHEDMVDPLRAGDYTLTCMLHPSMHAQLVVR